MLTTSDDSNFARVRTDQGQTSLEEGREFRLVRELDLDSGLSYWKFTCGVDFILFKQDLGVSVGDLKFKVYRAADVTDGGGWSVTPVPMFAKNISSEYRFYNGARYVSQTEVLTGGSVTVNNADNYADYDRKKTSNATSQRVTVGSSMDDKRYLAAGTYYFEFNADGAAEGRFELGIEERP